MKNLAISLILISLFLVSCDNQKELTEEEINDCETFVKLKGQDRYKEIKKLLHLLPEITNPETKITTREELRKYFGEPDNIRDDGTFVYVLNGPEKSSCTFIAFFDESGKINFTGFENCVDFQEE